MLIFLMCTAPFLLANLPVVAFTDQAVEKSPEIQVVVLLGLEGRLRKVAVHHIATPRQRNTEVLVVSGDVFKRC